MSPTDAAPTITDWMSAWGQVGGAAATVAAVIVALWIASRDRRRIEQDRIDEAHGNAAMVMSEVRGSGVIAIINHSPRPIREPRVIGVELDGSPDISWQPGEPGLPAVNVLGPGDVAETKRGFWIAIGPGAARSLQPGDVLGDVVTICATIEHHDTAGRRWTRCGFAPPINGNAGVRRSWWRRLLRK